MSADHHSHFQLGPDATRYRKLTGEGVRVETALGREIVVVEPEALRRLAEEVVGSANTIPTPSCSRGSRARFRMRR
jgi:fumarate hydratase class I